MFRILGDENFVSVGRGGIEKCLCMYVCVKRTSCIIQILLPGRPPPSYPRIIRGAGGETRRRARATKVCGWFSLICPTPEIIYTTPRTGPEESGGSFFFFLLLFFITSSSSSRPGKFDDGPTTFTIALDDRQRVNSRAHARLRKKIEVWRPSKWIKKFSSGGPKV